jgi:hypothetical protein
MSLIDLDYTSAEELADDIRLFEIEATALKARIETLERAATNWELHARAMESWAVRSLGGGNDERGQRRINAAREKRGLPLDPEGDHA